MDTNVNLNIDINDAVNILAMLSVVREKYAMYPESLESIKKYTKELNDKITKDQLDYVNASIELDISLRELNIKKDKDGDNKG